MSVVAAASERSVSDARGTAPETPATTHPGLYAELWTSFAGVLRSYAAAHGDNSKAQTILEISSDSILVRAGSWSLLVTRGANGAGTWQRETGEPVNFAFDEFGRIILEGHPEEMDLVAERLMRELLR